MPFERYKTDIDKLVRRGTLLEVAMLLEISPDSRKKFSAEFLDKLPKFQEEYQAWYSEALACVSQLMPHRREDFVSYYKPIKTRKSVDAENYSISDYLRGLSTTRASTQVVGPSAALQPFGQQVELLRL
jgi:hypothetical protein